MTFRLLTRDVFRAQVFTRDRHQCVVCGAPGSQSAHLDAHHIVERKLWPDGGYYLENGATLCETCHRAAEHTLISCNRLRELCLIESWPLPPHLEDPIDKWGNPILPNGKRMRGELFEEIKRNLPGGVLAEFVDRVKYPRTYHLPWSPGISKDDRVNSTFDYFMAGDVVVTAKMDGENTTLYGNGMHARSIDYHPNETRSWVKALQVRIGPDIPEGWRICGENLYAKHSIKYNHLTSYFQVFSIWDRSRCLSWAMTCEWAELLDLQLVPVLYKGPWDEKLIRQLHTPTLNGDHCEGYVVRTTDEFHLRDFRRAVSKFVRAGHVQTDEHWMHQAIERNLLRAK